MKILPQVILFFVGVVFTGHFSLAGVPGPEAYMDELGLNFRLADEIVNSADNKFFFYQGQMINAQNTPSLDPGAPENWGKLYCFYAKKVSFGGLEESGHVTRYLHSLISIKDFELHKFYVNLTKSTDFGFNGWTHIRHFEKHQEALGCFIASNPKAREVRKRDIKISEMKDTFGDYVLFDDTGYGSKIEELKRQIESLSIMNATKEAKMNELETELNVRATLIEKLRKEIIRKKVSSLKSDKG